VVLTVSAQILIDPQLLPPAFDDGRGHRAALLHFNTDQGEAAVFNFDKARIFTRMLAGFAAALTISPVAGLRTKVPAFRAGTLRRDTFRSPGRANSPTPRGCTDPRNTPSSVAYTAAAVLRGMSLRAESVAPDSAMFELVMASNYATYGFDVAFIEEARGQARTPDLRLSASGLSKPIFVECKRLKRGQYEIQEQAKQKKAVS
jgi:hypothetical protein